MCSFMFLMQNGKAAVTKEDLIRANKYMRARGPESTNVITVDNMIFLHNMLHLCEGLGVPQPVVKDNGLVLLFNGEIYNWKELASGLGVVAAMGDTEVLLPLYERHGSGFVKMLDGEFALALYDSARKELVVSTDAFMTKPLWIGRGNDGTFGVASYKSALVEMGIPDGQVAMARPNECVVFSLNGSGGSEGRREPVQGWDLRQWKTGLEDWERAFEEAVRKRATHGGKMFLCLSSGYDSGCIALALKRLGIEHTTFSTYKGENMGVLNERLRLGRMEGIMDTCFTCAEVDASIQEECKNLVQDVCEPWTYVHDDGPGMARTEMCNDGGAKALGFICARMNKVGYRVVLSGSGADEVFSDYGFGGNKIYYHSQFGGMWPESLEDGFFPWRKFYDDTQRSYLFKDEYVAGGWAIEGRYPFLDTRVVQEWLWLSAEVKNAEYKHPLASYMRRHGYPMDQGKKSGFSI